jgi:hypothetical protein
LVKVQNNRSLLETKICNDLRDKICKKYLLFTDADCYPTSRMDYRNEFAVYNAKTIVLGYGGYEKIEIFP